MKFPCRDISPTSVDTSWNTSLKVAGHSSLSSSRNIPLLPIVWTLTAFSVGLSIVCLLLLLILLRLRSTYARKVRNLQGMNSISGTVYKLNPLQNCEVLHDLSLLSSTGTLLETGCQISESTRKLPGNLDVLPTSRTLPKNQGYPTIMSGPLQQLNNDLELNTFTISPV